MTHPTPWTALAAVALLLTVAAPVAADHPDNQCWSLGEATKCSVEDARDALDCPVPGTLDFLLCVALNEAQAASTYARRACDALTGQACTRP